MSITGTAELKARLRSIRVWFKPWGKDWADEAAAIARASVPVGKTGRLKASIRRQEASMRRARVVGHYTQYFVDAGTKPHMQPRHNYFSKRQHPGYRARPFRARAAREALRRRPMADTLIQQWNAAGGTVNFRGPQ